MSNSAENHQGGTWLLGFLALLAWGGTIAVYFLPTSARNVIPLSVRLLGFSPDGLTLVSLNRAKGTVTLADSATGMPKAELSARGAQEMAPAFSLDGKSIAVCCDEEIRVWDTESGKVRVIIPWGGHQQGGLQQNVALSADGARLAFTEAYEGGDRLQGHGNRKDRVGFAPLQSVRLLVGRQDVRHVRSGETDTLDVAAAHPWLCALGAWHFGRYAFTGLLVLRQAWMESRCRSRESSTKITVRDSAAIVG